MFFFFFNRFVYNYDKSEGKHVLAIYMTIKVMNIIACTSDLYRDITKMFMKNP